MAKTKTKEEGIDFIEDPDVLASRAEEFFNNSRNKTLVFSIGGVLAALVIGYLVYNYYITNQNEEAQKELFQATYYFEADSLGSALNGDGVNYGFLDIIDSYAGTEAAELSKYYAGVTYLKLGDFNSAIRYLTDFSSDDLLVQARAYSLTGDAYMEQEEYKQAADFYQKAADYKPNKEFSPIYLQKLAIAREMDGDFKGAAAAYGIIVDKYFESSLLQEAKKQKARLQGLAAE